MLDNSQSKHGNAVDIEMRGWIWTWIWNLAMEEMNGAYLDKKS